MMEEPVEVRCRDCGWTGTEDDVSLDLTQPDGIVEHCPQCDSERVENREAVTEE